MRLNRAFDVRILLTTTLVPSLSRVVWADAMAFALMIESQGRAIRLITEWEDPAPVAEREFLENILLKKQIGLPVEQALLEAGYGEADVKAMVKESSVE